METADDIFALPERAVAPLEPQPWGFRAALLAAVLCHAALFVEVGRSRPRTVGDASGQPDAIAVELVSAADLKSRETVALPPPGAAAPPVASAPQAQPAPPPHAHSAPPSEPAAQAPAPPSDAPTPSAKPAAEAPVAADDLSALPKLADIPLPEPDPAPSVAQEAATSKAKADEGPRTSDPPAEPARSGADAPKTPAVKKAAPAQKQARLTPPARDLDSAPPGRSAGATRPPGITRSGENDAFGREVVRALRATMPPPRGIFGRVTVRLLLTENGDLAEVRVIDPSGTRLDQDVMFATKQTYFPLPPHKSTVLDRTFVIRYVYR